MYDNDNEVATAFEKVVNQGGVERARRKARAPGRGLTTLPTEAELYAIAEDVAKSEPFNAWRIDYRVCYGIGEDRWIFVTEIHKRRDQPPAPVDPPQDVTIPRPKRR